MAGGVGVWDWNLVTGEIYVDPFLKELLGFEDHEIRHADEWTPRVHPDDASRERRSRSPGP
jgi:PAS domain-containing protein